MQIGFTHILNDVLNVLCQPTLWIYVYIDGKLHNHLPALVPEYVGAWY